MTVYNALTAWMRSRFVRRPEGRGPSERKNRLDMRPNRSRVPGSRLVSAVLGSGLAAIALTSGSLLGQPARAGQDQVAPVSFTLYRGEGNSGNIRLASWGSGKAEPTAENVLLGDAAIKVTTHGLYQGGRIEFKQPVDLAAALANPRTYLRMMVRFNRSSGSNVAGGFSGGSSGFPGGGFPGGGFDSTNTLANKPPFERIRFVALMGDGKQVELVRPMDMKPTDDPDAYMPITFPLAALKKSAGRALSGDAAKLKGLVVCGDTYQQFQIGEIQVITDDTEISVAPLEDQIAFINNEMVFSADGEGGASTLRFSWDFDAKDGIQEDATGRSVSHVFRKDGKFIITLTVTDVDGLKKPQTIKQELDVAQ